MTQPSWYLVILVFVMSLVSGGGFVVASIFTTVDVTFLRDICTASTGAVLALVYVHQATPAEVK